MTDALNNDSAAEFFQLVHQLIHSRRADETEKRELARQQFESFQRIASWDGRRFPRPSEFFVVRCMDLTRRGFSFLSPRTPSFDQLVVSLADGDQVVYLAAEVVRVEPVPVSLRNGVPGSDGEPGGVDSCPRGRMFLVGCRFTRRLQPPDRCD